MPLGQRLPVVAMIALVAACGGAPAATGGNADTATTAAPQATVPAGQPTPDPSRPMAPEFTLTLGDGSVYRSAEDTRPVYLVFWAEW